MADASERGKHETKKKFSPDLLISSVFVTIGLQLTAELTKNECVQFKTFSSLLRSNYTTFIIHSTVPVQRRVVSGVSMDFGFGQNSILMSSDLP